MRLKLYRASGMAEAMSAIRAELGADALILATRRVGSGVEVTAALPDEEDHPPPAPPPPPDPERLASLAFHNVPAAVADQLRHGKLSDALGQALPFAPLPLSQGARPLLFAGPAGAGKTLTVARLAARLVIGGVSPSVVTADGRRAGATEQLAAFTRLLGLNLLVANHPATLARAMAHRQAGAPMLIDAPGADPFDPAQRDEVAALAATADASVVLVLPAGLDPAEAADLASAFSAAGATMLVATRLDVTRRLGAVLAAAHAGGLALAEAGIGPGAADGLVPMTPGLLAERLLAAPPQIQPDRLP
ncbi:MAG: GTP-binding protein [Alphaproteobacteria bacterium]|nr:GTP-binding protein [Alphaproteobacteria bacterium]